ncbi:MAG: hypothetical protein ACO3FE_03345 [Planctomycetaceae bacterium]
MKNPAQQLTRSTGRSLRGHGGAAHRAGVSLIEVIAAAAILAMALAALGQQVYTGYKASLRSELQAEASVRCQSAVSRLMSANLSGLPVRMKAFEDDRRWLWSATLRNTERFAGLKQLEVSVHRSGDRVNSEWSIVRLVRTDPLRSSPLAGGFP